MNRPNASMAHITHMARRLSWPGALGLLCLIGAAWLHWQTLPQQREALAHTESDTRRLRHELQARAAQAEAAQAASAAASASVVPTVPHDQQAAWAQLWSTLPDASRRAALQQAVFDAAAQSGVPLGGVQMRGDWVSWVPQGLPVRAVSAARSASSAQPDASEGNAPQGQQGLWRLRLVMPVQAPYPAIRTWLARLLREPALTVDALDIQRGDALSDQVKAQVSVSLWWRQDREAL